MDTQFKSDETETQPEVGASLPGRHRTVPPPQPTSTQYDAQKATRRTWSVAEKLRIVERVKEAGYGRMGNILREEGVYSTQYNAWRRQHEEGFLDGGTTKPRGPAKRQVHPLEKDYARVVAELEVANLKLRQAETLIGLQKKFSEMMASSLR